MKKKLLCFFGGTGVPATDLERYYFPLNFQEDVIVLYFNGCHDKRIGGKMKYRGIISPNLDVVSSQLNACFDGDRLDLDQLQEKFGDAVIVQDNAATVSEAETISPAAPQANEITSPANLEAADPKRAQERGSVQPLAEKKSTVEIESILLQGFSRGAVTTFAAARHLNHLNIPITLIAVDPVPGNTKFSALKTESEFTKNWDLRACTNLKKALVTIGAYSNDIDTIHNTYFKQMVPAFPENTVSSVLLTPKKYHLDESLRRELEHTFLKIYDDQGLTNMNLSEETFQTYLPLFYTPKVLRQKLHQGAIGRIEFLPLYKRQVFNQALRIQKQMHGSFQEFNENAPLKLGQAIVALGYGPDTPQIHALSLKVLENTQEAKALREFVVEFENINQYIFSKIVPPEKREALKPSLQTFRERIYGLLNHHASVISQAGGFISPEVKQAFQHAMLAEVAHLKTKLPSAVFQQFQKTTQAFLKNNVIFHPDLLEFIDESETYQNPPEDIHSERFLKTISEIDNLTALTERLYHMSPKAITQHFDSLTTKIRTLIKESSLDQEEKLVAAGKILRFFSPDQISSLLAHKEISGLIRTPADVSEILKYLFTYEQRKAVFKTTNSKIENPTFLMASELLQYLSLDKAQKFFQKHPLQQFADSNLLDLFTHLPPEKISLFQPLIRAQLKLLSKEQEQRLISSLKNYFNDAATKSVEESLKNLALLPDFLMAFPADEQLQALYVAEAKRLGAIILQRIDSNRSILAESGIQRLEELKKMLTESTDPELLKQTVFTLVDFQQEASKQNALYQFQKQIEHIMAAENRQPPLEKMIALLRLNKAFSLFEAQSPNLAFSNVLTAALQSVAQNINSFQQDQPLADQLKLVSTDRHKISKILKHWLETNLVKDLKTHLANLDSGENRAEIFQQELDRYLAVQDVLETSTQEAIEVLLYKSIEKLLVETNTKIEEHLSMLSENQAQTLLAPLNSLTERYASSGLFTDYRAILDHAQSVLKFLQKMKEETRAILETNSNYSIEKNFQQLSQHLESYLVLKDSLSEEIKNAIESKLTSGFQNLIQRMKHEILRVLGEENMATWELPIFSNPSMGSLSELQVLCNQYKKVLNSPEFSLIQKSQSTINQLLDSYLSNTLSLPEFGQKLSALKENLKGLSFKAKENLLQTIDQHMEMFTIANELTALLRKAPPAEHKFATEVRAPRSTPGAKAHPGLNAFAGPQKLGLFGKRTQAPLLPTITDEEIKKIKALSAKLKTLPFESVLKKKREDDFIGEEYGANLRNFTDLQSRVVSVLSRIEVQMVSSSPSQNENPSAKPS